MVDAAQAARPHVVDGREVETKRAVPKGVSFFFVKDTVLLTRLPSVYFLKAVPFTHDYVLMIMCMQRVFI